MATVAEREAKREDARRRRAARAEKRRESIVRSGGGYLRAADLVVRWGVTLPTIWSWWARKKILPPPATIGPNSKGWPVDVILEFEKAKAA